MLIQGEADQQRHRIGRDQLVGLVGVGEVQAVWHDSILVGILPEVSENAELVRSWHKAAERATHLDRLEDLLALTHPEFEMTEASALPGAVHVKGLEALRSYCYGRARNWSAWEWREEELVDLPPDRVMFDATLRLMGLRSSIWVEHRWVYLFVIRDGLILRDDGFLSKDEALAASSESVVER